MTKEKTTNIHGHDIPLVTPEELPDKLREMGVDPDNVEIVTPQFERPKNDPPAACTPVDWGALQEMDASALREVGLRPWNDPKDEEDDWPHKGKVLWLLPGEWYEHIPAGFEVFDIFGGRESFVPGQTDNDIRFGCLPYGLLRVATPAQRGEGR